MIISYCGSAQEAVKSSLAGYASGQGQGEERDKKGLRAEQREEVVYLPRATPSVNAALKGSSSKVLSYLKVGVGQDGS